MHTALLIDEILQVIFDFCSEVADEPRQTFARLARCCRAWKDPALDRLWARLNGIEPLLALLPDDSKTANFAPSPSFLAYASRVRRIVHNKDRLLVPASETGVPILNNLEDVTLSFQGCMALAAWSFSSRLKRVAVNIGFSRSDQDMLDRSNAVAMFLQWALTSAPDLRSLQVRGRMTDALNGAVASLAQLRSLTIQGNCFLACHTLAAIATFPELRVLELHASHIAAEEFDDALSRYSTDTAYFPALEELTIRTSGPLLAAIVARLPTGVLAKLHVDMDACVRGPSYMKPIFALLAQKASTSLHELAIEDRTELDELAAEPELRPLNQNHNQDQNVEHDLTEDDDTKTPRWYTLDTLNPLARLPHLRRFVLRDPDLRAADLAQLSTWWPTLAHLHLGTHDADAETETPPPEWKVRMGPEAYAAAARAFPRLESLALPAVPPSSCDVTAPRQTVLRSLAVGDVPEAAASAVGVVDALLALFPSLTTLDCESSAVSERFETVLRGSVTL